MLSNLSDVFWLAECVDRNLFDCDIAVKFGAALTRAGEIIDQACAFSFILGI